MDDRDFLNALKTGQTFSKEASEYFSELRKSAGAKELVGKGLGKAVKFVSEKKAPLLGAAIGAATATALQYLANKPGKDGKPSTQRRLAESSLKSKEEAHAKNPSGFSEQMGLNRAKAGVDVARTSEQHPKRGALLAAPMGALGGMGLGYAARNLVG